MLIIERGAQRYVVDSESGKVTPFDPALHDAGGQVAPLKSRLKLIHSPLREAESEQPA